MTIGKYGYILARMPFEIVLMPEAIEDLKRFKARARAEIRAALETHLRHEPQKVSRSRIKRLRVRGARADDECEEHRERPR